MGCICENKYTGQTKDFSDLTKAEYKDYIYVDIYGNVIQVDETFICEEQCESTASTDCIFIKKDYDKLGIKRGEQLTSALDKLDLNKQDIQVVWQDTKSIDFTGSGLSTTPLKADVRISPDAGNNLSIKDNGLYSAIPDNVLQDLMGGRAITVTTDPVTKKKSISAFAAPTEFNPIIVGTNGLDFNMDNFKKLFNIVSPEPGQSPLQRNDFVLSDYRVQTNYNGNHNAIFASNSSVKNLTDKKVWTINEREISLTNPTSIYYLYVKIPKDSTTASWIISENLLDHIDELNYYTSAGIISEVINGTRQIYRTDGRITISGDQIRLGKIASVDGQNYFDLVNNKFRIGNNESSLDYNVTSPNTVTIKGYLLQRPNGDVIQAPSFRGEYDPSITYYQNDMVSYQGSLYTYIAIVPGRNILPTNTVSWKVTVAKGTDGKDGTNGQNAPLIPYTEFRYQKSANPNIAPAIDVTQREPQGWTKSINDLTVGPLEYVWVITTQKDPVTHDLKSNWQGPNRITGLTGPKGDPGQAGYTPRSIYPSFVFKRSATQPDTPVGGSFLNPVPEGWEDGTPEGEGILWMSQRMFTSDGIGQDASWSLPINMTSSSKMQVYYSSSTKDISQIGDPTTNPTEWRIASSVDNIWMAVRMMENGAPVPTPGNVNGWVINKIKGEAGKDAIGYFKSIVFKRSNTAPATPTGGTWDNPVPPGWSDGVPAGEAMIWISSKMFASDPTINGNYTWTIPQKASDSATIDFEWSSLSRDPRVEPKSNPTTNPSDWHNDATPEDKWMALRAIKNGVPEEWQIVQVKGEKGEKGSDGKSAYEVWKSLPGNANKTEEDYKNFIKGPAGPFIVTRGSFDMDKKYFGDTSRIDAVYYTNSDPAKAGWYRTLPTLPLEGIQGIEPTDTTKWVKFTAQFDSIATDLFLAQVAFIKNLGVHYLRTGDAGKGNPNSEHMEVYPSYNTLTAYRAAGDEGFGGLTDDDLRNVANTLKVYDSGDFGNRSKAEVDKHSLVTLYGSNLTSKQGKALYKVTGTNGSGQPIREYLIDETEYVKRYWGESYLTTYAQDRGYLIDESYNYTITPEGRLYMRGTGYLSSHKDILNISPKSFNISRDRGNNTVNNARLDTDGLEISDKSPYSGFNATTVTSRSIGVRDLLVRSSINNQGYKKYTDIEPNTGTKELVIITDAAGSFVNLSCPLWPGETIEKTAYSYTVVNTTSSPKLVQMHPMDIPVGNMTFYNQSGQVVSNGFTVPAKGTIQVVYYNRAAYLI